MGSQKTVLHLQKNRTFMDVSTFCKDGVLLAGSRQWIARSHVTNSLYASTHERMFSEGVFRTAPHIQLGLLQEYSSPEFFSLRKAFRL